MENLTLQVLSDKLNGNYWEKGDLKRIYLDEGYNTKKMSTKTFVFEKDGEFIVSCHIECPSQPYQWIESQENEIKEGVYKCIERIERINSLTLSDHKIVSENEVEIMVYVSENNKDAVWYTEDTFEEEFYYYINDVFDIPAFTEILENRAKEMEAIRAKHAAQKTANEVKIKAEKQEEAKELKASVLIPNEGNRVNHKKFGLGTVKYCDSDTIEVLFDNMEVGMKKLLTKFVKLEIVEK